MFVDFTSAPVGKSAALSAYFGPLSPGVPQVAVEKCAWEDSNPRPAA
jgi:hypothetical protein